MQAAWPQECTLALEAQEGELQPKCHQGRGLAFLIAQFVEAYAFELWYWRRLLRVPWTARQSNQSILKEINSGYSLEGLMLMLKLQYFGHLIRRANSLEKILMLGKREEG